VKILWSERAWLDYLHWQAEDAKMVAKVNEMIRDVRRSHFVGIGKPEPLKGELAGWWSRRLTSEHRFIYRVTGVADNQVLNIAGCRYHYGK
jgi:toxin YoeB